MNAVLAVAFKEFRDGLRDRWVLAITLIFAVFGLGLAWFGGAASGSVGFTGLAATIVSLASLAVFLIPLIALLLAYDAIVGEAQAGTLLLLLSYPLGRGQLLLGKFLGHGMILTVATVLGFGGAGLVIAWLAQDSDPVQVWTALGLFVVSADLLGLSFIALAYLISVSVVDKARAAGLALVLWFALVLVYDLGLLGLLVLTEGAVGERVFPWLLLLNPTDVFRLINLTGFEAARVQAGLTTIAAGQQFHPTWLLAVLVAWVAAPLGLAVWLFRRRAL